MDKKLKPTKINFNKLLLLWNINLATISNTRWPLYMWNMVLRVYSKPKKSVLLPKQSATSWVERIDTRRKKLNPTSTSSSLLLLNFPTSILWGFFNYLSGMELNCSFFLLGNASCLFMNHLFSRSLYKSDRVFKRKELTESQQIATCNEVSSKMLMLLDIERVRQLITCWYILIK